MAGHFHTKKLHLTNLFVLKMTICFCSENNLSVCLCVCEVLFKKGTMLELCSEASTAPQWRFHSEWLHDSVNLQCNLWHCWPGHFEVTIKIVAFKAQRDIFVYLYLLMAIVGGNRWEFKRASKSNVQANILQPLAQQVSQFTCGTQDLWAQLISTLSKLMQMAPFLRIQLLKGF